MDTAVVVKLLLMLSIVLIVVSIGLRARFADLRDLAASPGLYVRSMLAMFVVMPLFTMILLKLFPLAAPVPAALIALSISPMPPLLPRKQAKAGGDADYIICLQVLATIVAIAAAPLLVLIAGRVFGVETDYDPAVVVKTLAITVALPLALGMAGNRLAPAVSERLAGPVGMAGTVLLAVCSLALLYATAPLLAGMIGNGVLLAAAVIAVVGLAAGHLLGGPGDANRGALAVATATRHPGVAIGLAASTLGLDKPPVIAAVLLALVTGMVISIPYMRWRKGALAAAV